MTARFLLRTSHRVCTCGQKHTSVDLFEVHREGQTGLERRIPWKEPTLPQNAAVKVEVTTTPLATCPVCVHARFASESVVPVQHIPAGVRALVQENMWKHPVRSKLRIPGPEKAAAPKAKVSSAMSNWEFRDIMESF